jgi:mannose-6-phosphate isomerase-like protein (cupin superfamily)
VVERGGAALGAFGPTPPIAWTKTAHRCQRRPYDLWRTIRKRASGDDRGRANQSLIGQREIPMPDFTAKRIDEMEAAFGGGFVKVRAELGVTSFGVQVIQLPPDHSDYPLHDHVESGQEEVFLALSGSGWIEIDDERVDLEPNLLVRVGPEPKRKIFAGAEGLRVLALGAAPGRAYEINPMTELAEASA